MDRHPPFNYAELGFPKHMPSHFDGDVPIKISGFGPWDQFRLFRSMLDPVNTSIAEHINIRQE